MRFLFFISKNLAFFKKNEPCQQSCNCRFLASSRRVVKNEWRLELGPRPRRRLALFAFASAAVKFPTSGFEENAPCPGSESALSPMRMMMGFIIQAPLSLSAPSGVKNCEMSDTCRATAASRKPVYTLPASGKKLCGRERGWG